MHRHLLLAALAATGCLLTPAGADWPTYRGPTQNGIAADNLPPNLANLLPRWKAEVGTGTSALVVSNQHVFTMGNVRNKDTVWCLDAASGRVVWKHEYKLASDPRMFEGGPAATPTVDGHHVYTLSHQGDLFCLEAGSGRPIWYKHLQQDFKGQRPEWGYAGSPLIEGNLVILDAGARHASTVALDKLTGKLVWSSGGDDAGYASPLAADLAGQRTVVLFKATALIGLDPQTGRERWRTPWKTSYNVNAATPLISGNRIFISSGYGRGCALFEISASGANKRWENKSLTAHFSSPVIWQGAIYGIDENASPKSPLVCLDLETGKVKWEEKLGGGSLVMANAKLVILSEAGELIIGEANPLGFKAAYREQVLGKRCWVQPTVANGWVFCRNNNGSVAAVGSP